VQDAQPSVGKLDAHHLERRARLIVAKKQQCLVRPLRRCRRADEVQAGMGVT